MTKPIVHSAALLTAVFDKLVIALYILFSSAVKILKDDHLEFWWCWISLEVAFVFNMLQYAWMHEYAFKVLALDTEVDSSLGFFEILLGFYEILKVFVRLSEV